MSASMTTRRPFFGGGRATLANARDIVQGNARSVQGGDCSSLESENQTYWQCPVKANTVHDLCELKANTSKGVRLAPPDIRGSLGGAVRTRLGHAVGQSIHAEYAKLGIMRGKCVIP